MRSLRGLTAAIAAVALVVAAQLTAATTTSVVTVGSSAVPGADTGIVLVDGMSVTVTATGTFCPGGTLPCVTPDGNPAVDTTQSGYGGFVLPGAPAWGLLARVGSGPWLHVGSGPATLSGSGDLVFAVNDDYFGDNAGDFVATVTVSTPDTTPGEPAPCKPGWGHGDRNHEHCGPPGLAGKDAAVDAPSSAGHANGNGNGNGKTAG